MSFADQLSKFKVISETECSRFVHAVVRETGRRLIERSPIDTGKFVSNWRYGLESPDTTVTEETSIRTLNNLSEMPARAIGFIHYITNSVHYGPYLEAGSSKQAPRGMVELTAMEADTIFAVAARKVGL